MAEKCGRSLQKSEYPAAVSTFLERAGFKTGSFFAAIIDGITLAAAGKIRLTEWRAKGGKKVTSLNRLVGLPVVLNGRRIGQIERAFLNKSGKMLGGIVVRNGIRGAKWLSHAHVLALGGVCVLAKDEPEKVPKDARFTLSRVQDTSGLRLGVVTDALIDTDSMQVMALEISSGPVDDFMHGRLYAKEFVVKISRASPEEGDVLIPCGGLSAVQAEMSKEE